MKSEDLDMIMQLMGDLKDKMAMKPEHFDERLGRDKPQLDVIKIKGEMPMGDEGKDDDDAMAMMGHGGMGMDDDKGDSGDDDMPMDDSPEMRLKQRLMKMRG